MARFTFSDATTAATFEDLFTDSETATWYQLWTGNSSGGSYVDTSVFNVYGNGWINEEDLDQLDVDFAQADDTSLYIRPWDGSATSDSWESGTVSFSYASENYITTSITSDTTMDQMFTDLDVSSNTWYRFWIGNSAGTSGSFVDTSSLNAYGNGWVEASDLSSATFSLSDAGNDLWVQTFVAETNVDDWESWTVEKGITIGDVSVTEGAGTATFTITLPEAVDSGETVVLNYSTESGTATGGSDYETLSGSLTFIAGESSKQVLVTITDDSVADEDDETFNFVVTNTAQSDYVSQATGTGTIVDNDSSSLTTISVGDVSASEGDGTATFTITLGEAVGTGETLELSYATSDGTATAGSDYTAATGTVTIAAGASTGQVQVSITDDSVTGEDNETFTLTVTNSSNSEYVDLATGTGTIIDNDDADDDTITTPETSGSEFLINTTAVYNQEDPCAADLSNGGFVTLWESQSQDGSEYGIYGQRYDEDGTAVNSEFLVNTETDNFQLAPSVDGLVGGGMVAVWQSLGQDGSGYGIYGERYNSTYTATGEFLINTTTAFNQEAPSVAALVSSGSDDGFIVVWQSAGQDGSGYGIYGERYDNTYAATGEFVVNTTTDDNQDSPYVTGLTGGGFVVTWASDNQDGDGYGIYMRQYSATYTAGTETIVNTTTDGDQKSCAAEALADGGFLVTWVSDDQDGSGFGVYGQRFDSSGATVDDEFRVNTYTTSNQEAPSVESLADGGWVIAWESYGQDGSQEGIFAQRYNGSGTAVGSEFQVTTTTSDDQESPSVASIFDLGFVVTWESNDQDGSGTGIYGQLYSINSADPLSMSCQEAANTDIETQDFNPASQIELTGIQNAFQDNGFQIWDGIY